MDPKKFIRDVPNFPKEGIIFKDITPLWLDGEASRYVIDTIATRHLHSRIDKVVSAEARGFIIGAPVAYRLSAGFVPVRKPGKLPHKTISATYELEYGIDTLEMHEDSIKSNERVLIIDDLLATGGTAAALVDLVEKLRGIVVEIIFLVELTFLNGRKKISDYNLFTLVQY
jgi:adenine phosphoribosyltransferase